MELDRQSIEKRDFPIGRRGYEPDAVDAHLEVVAAEVEALRRSARSRSGASLASAASAQVQAIVEAAETSAADIEREASLEATRIRQDAQREADRVRDDAVDQAQERVGVVSEAADTMLQRVDAMESELGALFESLRTGAHRLSADLSLLQGNMGELRAASGSRRDEAFEPEAPARPEERGQHSAGASRERAGAEGPPPGPAPPDGGPGPAVAPAAPVSPPTPAPAPVGDRPPGSTGAAPGPAEDADVEGARLIALNMALDGQPRTETDRYLAENFELPDRAGLLEEVYAAVGG